MGELLDILTKAGIPGTLVAILISAAWVISDRLRKQDAPKKEAQQTHASEAMVKQLLDQISHTQKAESECARRISQIERELELKDARIEVLEAASEAKTRQIDALFSIILRGAGSIAAPGATSRMASWIAEHFSAEDLIILAAKVGLPAPLQGQGLELQCQEMVMGAARKNLLGELTRIAMSERPNVAPW